MYSLARLTLGDMAQASTRLRRLGAGLRSMEAVSQRICELLYRDLVDETGGAPACALVRLYTTKRLGELPPDLQATATGFLDPSAALPEVRCLVLLGTAGLEPAWMNRHDSKGHRAIPMPSVEAIERLPMVSRLVAALGVDAGMLVSGQAPRAPVSAEAGGRAFNVFHVAEAQGSVHIPAQDFVERYGVKSVLGCGGLFPDGELFALLTFSRVAMGRDTVDAFQPLTMAVKLALMPFAGERVFEESHAGA